jgi:hypothetical protein
MAHGEAREGKCRGNWRMEWVASTLTLPRNVVYQALLTLMRTPRLPAVDWTDFPADLNGFVRFGEKMKSGFCACTITFQMHYTRWCPPSFQISVVASLPLTDIYLYTKERTVEVSIFSNHWECTIFSQLPSDLLFHISSFPPCDDLYCIAVVKFHLYNSRENFWEKVFCMRPTRTFTKIHLTC